MARLGWVRERRQRFKADDVQSCPGSERNLSAILRRSADSSWSVSDADSERFVKRLLAHALSLGQRCPTRPAIFPQIWRAIDIRSRSHRNDNRALDADALPYNNRLESSSFSACEYSLIRNRYF